MHRAIGYLSKRMTQIRPGEGRKVLLTFLYFFLIITAYYVIKPVSRSLVLGELGSRMVPYVDLVSAILMGPIVTLFARLVDRVSKRRLVSLSFGVVTGALILFWSLLHWSDPWIAGAFYVWVAIFSVLVVTLFWLVANDLYHPREAKRLFGFIGSGGILGGIVGSSIAAVGAQLIGTERLLLLSAGLLALCWFVVQQLWRFAPDHDASEQTSASAAHHETFLSDIRGFAKLFLQSRYLLLLVAMVGLNKLIATLVYYQLNPFIEQTFLNQDAKTTFTGMFFGGMNVVAFIVQFFFTSWILRRWGLSVALLALPLGVLVGTSSLLVLPVFWIAVATELYDGSLNYSLQQTSKEVLYLPIDRSVRYKVKPFIDMVVFRFGKGFAAIIGIVLLDALKLPANYLSFVAVPLLIAWLFIAVWLRRDYTAMIRTVLQARTASRRTHVPPAAPGSPDEAGRIGRGEPTESFELLTDGQLSVMKLSLIGRLVATTEPPPSHAKALTAELKAYETHVASPSELEHDVAHLKATIGNPQEPMAKRRQAVRLLGRCADQSRVDYLLGIVMVEGDAGLRQEALKGLVRLRLRGGRFDLPAQTIRRQIAMEVASHQRVVRVADIVHQYHQGPLAADDPAIALLRALLEESVEQTFRLLMLLYRPEDIQLIYEQMRAPDGYLRADALELLDNLVDSAMRTTLLPIFDEDRFLSLLDEEPRAVHEPATAYRVLQEAIWDHNCWLSVTTLCTVGRLRLTTMRQELEKASRHAAGPIATAAKVALHLSTLS